MKIHMTGAEWFASRAGGLNRYFESLFEALHRQPGVDVEAHAFGDAPADGHSWGPTGRGIARRVFASRSVPRVDPGDVVDRHFALYGPALGRVERNRGVPVIHFQGPWSLESRASGQREAVVRAKRLFERSRYGGARAAVVLCEEFAGILAEEFGFPSDRIVVLPPGVDLQKFTSTALPSAGSERSVVCVRRLERRMGIDVLLAAWVDVVDSVPGAVLDVVGTGTEERALRSLVDDLRLTTQVRFHGRVADDKLADLYAGCSATVVPTRSLEGFGLIALESLASGRAPIVTRIGGLPDSVKGFDDSLIVTPEEPDELAGRLIDALGGRVPSAEACRAHAQTFDWSLVAGRHVDLYRKLAS